MIYDIKARCIGKVDGKACGRFLKVKAMGSSSVIVTCEDRKCKYENTIKVVMLSDMVGKHHNHSEEKTDSKAEEYKQTIKELQAKADELDGRTKEAKELKAQIEDMQKYIDQLEGILDGQG